MHRYHLLIMSSLFAAITCGASQKNEKQLVYKEHPLVPDKDNGKISYHRPEPLILVKAPLYSRCFKWCLAACCGCCKQNAPKENNESAK